MPLITDAPKQTIALPNVQITASFTSPQVTVPVNTKEVRIAVDATAWPVDSAMSVRIEISPDGVVPFVGVVAGTIVHGNVSSIGAVFDPPTSAGLKARAVIALTGSPVQLVGSARLY